MIYFTFKLKTDSAQSSAKSAEMFYLRCTHGRVTFGTLFKPRKNA